MKTVEERLKSYEPLWENWTYTGNFLGEGAMSSVFEIQSTAMGLKEVAALKIVTVKKNHHDRVEIPDSALNEIKILRALSSCPNIVHYHDSTQRKIYDENDQLSEIDILIKMEKLKPLNEGEKLGENQVIKLGMDVCKALMYASEHGIIHRDIKPQNIFVDVDGTYKLGDFGIAKIVSEFSSHYTMNIGTVAYTAPEICRNTTGSYGISSDVYSLGLVLYVFLNNGALPFVNTEESLHGAITKRISGAPFPSPANGSKNLKAIVMRACSADLVKRYKTPAEMLEDLELLATGGKKLVADPFATLDASIDVFETNYGSDSWKGAGGVETTGSDVGTSKPGRLINRMKRSTSDHDEMETKMDKAPAGGKLRINMRSKADAETGVSDGEITKVQSDSALKRGEEKNISGASEEKLTTDEKKKTSSFFSAPDSI